MKQEIIDKQAYEKMSEIQKGFFNGYRKAMMIMVFGEGVEEFDEESVKIVEKTAHVFVGELSDETLNPSKYYPVTAVAGANSNLQTK